jgi:hypothetical protein
LQGKKQDLISSRRGIMRKCLIALVAVIAVAMVAAPAMADMKASGFYRSKAWLSNFHDGGGGPSLRNSDQEQTNAYVEQRFRVKFDFGTENVKAVWYLESDMLWGDSSGAVGRNQGGAAGGDSINTETKNIYVWFKIPDTSMDFTVGLQAQKDAYEGVFYNADLAGIFMTGKYEPIGYTLGWAKLYGDDSSSVQLSDDVTLYQAEVGWSPNKETKLGFNFYFLQDDAGRNPTGAARLDPTAGSFGPSSPVDFYKLRLYMPGIDASMKLGPAALSGFIFYQTGTFESFIGDPDIDVSAYGIDVRADMALGPGKFFIEGLYLSGGDNSGNDYDAPITLGDYQANGSNTGPGGYSSYTRTRMQILLASWDTINVSQCLIGCSGGEYGDSLGNGGRGLWHIAAGYNQKFSDKLSGEVNIGYMAATDLLEGESSFRDKDFGTEINAGVAYSVAKGLSVGVYGAYVFLGDFVADDATSDFQDP